MHLIFDFDGTLVDSFYCVVDVFNALAVDFNFRKISVDEIDDLMFNSNELQGNIERTYVIAIGRQPV